MRRWSTRAASEVGLALVLLAAIAAPVRGAPPYRIVVSGPGIDGERVVWLAGDEETIQALYSGLLSEIPVEPPGPSALPYEITWYFGECWAESTPCQEDPETFTTHATRYAYDRELFRGALSHLESPGWFEQPPQGAETWYQTPPEFDRAIQRILVLEGAPAELFQPILGILPTGGSPGSMTWLIGVAALAIAWYLLRRGQTNT
jgi:hypothetical protein